MMHNRLFFLFGVYRNVTLTLCFNAKTVIFVFIRYQFHILLHPNCPVRLACWLASPRHDPDHMASEAAVARVGTLYSIIPQ